MPIQVFKHQTKHEAGRSAAQSGAELIRAAVLRNGYANVIMATGASQFEMIQALVKEDVPWEKVTAFHLDEYVGIPVSHPASFRQYLWERFQRALPRPLRNFHYVDGEAEPNLECQRLHKIITEHAIDVCFAGIGENAHLAFNDPPADFQSDAAYLVVNLDEACRRQQFGEGWFPSLDSVPRQAISMSVRQILKSSHIIITAPDERKARAVKETVTGPVTNTVPASILQNHGDVALHLDDESGKLLP